MATERDILLYIGTGKPAKEIFDDGVSFGLKRGRKRIWDPARILVKGSDATFGDYTKDILLSYVDLLWDTCNKMLEGIDRSKDARV